MQNLSKKYWRISLSAVTVIVLLALFLAPGFVKRIAVNKSKELIGRQISLEKLKINYFTSTIRLIDFKMFEANEIDLFVSFDTLLVNLAPLRLIKNEKVMEQLFLKGLTTNIVQYDSIFNFTDLLEFHRSEPDTTLDEPFKYFLSKLEMQKANIKYTDASIDKTIVLRDLNFYIPYIAWNQEDKSEAGVKFNFLKEGYFESSLQVDPNEGIFDANIIIHRLYLDAFSDFLKKSVQLDSIGGVISSNINIEGDLDEIEKSVVSGSVELLDFELTDLNRRKLVELNKMFLLLDAIDLNNNKFIVDSLTLTQPFIHFELYDSTNNFFDFLGIHPTPEGDTVLKTDSSEDVKQTGVTSPISFAMNSFIIDHGIIDYTDHRTPEPFNYHLSEVSMLVDSISSQQDWIDTYSRMLLNNRGKLNVELGFNPQDLMNMNLDIVITDFLLSDLNIYSRHYLGSPIIKGDMYYKSNTIISGGQLSSENRLLIENVEIGDKVGGLHDIPLKFALFLLKDRQGIINLDVPVSGDLKDQKVSVGKIIWNTFKNLIFKTVAAPYDLLAGMLGVDPKDVRSIEFSYADTTMTDKIKNQLDNLLSLEEQKEGLGIELIYFNDIEKEKIQFNEDDLTDPGVIDSLVIIFNQKRVSLVNDYLNSVNDSTLIFTSYSNPEAPGNYGSIPRFEVKYSLKENQ